MPSLTLLSATLLTVLVLSMASANDEPTTWQPGPRAPWPQATPTAPCINAADFSPPICLPENAKTEDFHKNPDATDALQRALDAGAGGLVYIPAGQYRVTRPLSVQTGTTVMGAGHCSTILSTEAAIPAILHLKGVGGPMTTIRDLWTAGPVGGNWEATGIWLDGCNGVTVRDCWVSALQTGIRVDGISDTWLRNIVFELNQHGIVVQCAELNWASGNLRMLDCYGYQNYQTGITLENCRGVQMDACSSVGSGTAIEAKGCAQMTITGAQVNWDRSPWRKFGIRLERCDHVTVTGSVVEGMVQFGIAAQGCRHLTMTGNVIRNTTAGPGLLLDACELATVLANTISESARDGITVRACADTVLQGNLVDTFGQAPGEAETPVGIRLTGDCKGCTSEGNVVRE